MQPPKTNSIGKGLEITGAKMFTVHGASGVDGTQFQLLRKMEGGVGNLWNL